MRGHFDFADLADYVLQLMRTGTIIVSDQPTRTRNVNRLSFALLFTLGLLCLAWGPFSASTAQYLRPMKYLWLLGFIVVLVLRPEFRKAVWGREDGT